MEVEISPSSSPLLIDPSLLLSDDALVWLEQDTAARSEIILSGAFVEALTGQTDADLLSFLAVEDQQAFSERRRRLASLVVGIAVFSHREVDLR